MKLEDVKAIQILDSRGNPTIKAYVRVEGHWSSFSVPAGASKGSHEAVELRDGQKGYNGLSVGKAISKIETVIRDALVGMKISDQKKIDQKLIDLDGTKDKSKLGGNAILAVSGAVARAGADYFHLPLYQYLKGLYEQDGTFDPHKQIEGDFVLPDLYMNILNGGKHAENKVDFQETMIVPKRATVEEKVRVASEVYRSLKELLLSKNLGVGLGDEGGFAPDLESNTKAIEVVMEAISQAGYKPGKDVSIALDIAATELFDQDKDEKYILTNEGIGLSAMQLASLYKELITNYPIVSIEDGLAEDDWDGWKMMTERIGDKVQLIGDDLFVTNTERIGRAIKEKVANSVLIKMNQTGTITETFEAIRLAKKSGYKVMISHRSGETEDAFIADLAVATSAGQIKAGAPARSERTAKYNRLIEIEKEIRK
jgi:enolase